MKRASGENMDSSKKSEHALYTCFYVYIKTWVWAKIEYTNYWMVNTKNRLKSVVPQVFNFDPHPHAYIYALCPSQRALRRDVAS